MKKLYAMIISILLVLAGCSTDKKEEELVIYATRHGKTVFNTMDRVQGWADTPLTEEGIEVAEALGKGLHKEDIKFKNVYSSDLGRARETARIVLKEVEQEDLAIHEIIGLREASYGPFEGDFNSNMADAIGQYYGYKDAAEFSEKTEQFWIDAANALYALDDDKVAENADQIIERMQASLKEIQEENPEGGNVLLVGHGMSISLLIDSLADDSLEFSGHLPNASVSKIVYRDGQFIVESIGDTSFIELGQE